MIILHLVQIIVKFIPKKCFATLKVTKTICLNEHWHMFKAVIVKNILKLIKSVSVIQTKQYILFVKDIIE